MEIWRTVDGTEGKLEVSNLGRVRSNLRDGRILKTQKDAKGYHRLSVTINRKKRTYKLHRVVAMAFIPNPDNLPQVNHKDGDKSNNCADNLEWVSNADNARHAIENGLWNSVYAGAQKSNERRKKAITATHLESGLQIRFESVADAERYVGSRHITDVLKGKRAQAKGFSFAYEKGGDACGHY